MQQYSNQYGQIYQNQYLDIYSSDIKPDAQLTHQKMKEGEKTNVDLAKNENDEIKLNNIL
jgi:hypothetical protein